MTRVLLLVIVASTASLATAADFLGTARCGDCWCITDDGTTCPSDTVGISDSFSDTDLLFGTFELTNSPNFLKLQSATGGDCFPFKDSVGAIDRYEESNLDQCIASDEDDDVVCGYVYDASSTTCEGRKYSIQNFASSNDAMASNAHIVHKGSCGVCSSAQDFSTRMKTYGTLEAESIKCAFSFTFSRDFPALVTCYAALGFTTPCATLWAHFAATNGSKCAAECIPGKGGITELNGPAPECAPSACMECQDEFRDDFDDFAGLEMQNAGITERITRDCDDFYRVIHDPCIGLDPDYDVGGAVDNSGDDTGGTTPASTPEETTATQTEEPEPSSGTTINGKTTYAMAAWLAFSFAAV